MLSNSPTDATQTRADPGLARSVIELIGFISLPAAALGVVAAFLGWRLSRAYFLSFGLHPGWTATDVIGLMIIAWVEVILVLVLCAALVLTRMALKRWVSSLPDLFQARVLLVFLGTAIFAGLVNVLVFFFPPDWFQLFYWTLINLVILFGWWCAAVIGDQLFRIRQAQVAGIPRRLNSILLVFYSSQPVTLLLTAAFVVYFLVQFAAGHGTYIGIRDKSEATHLPHISILTSTPLDIADGQVLSSGIPGENSYWYSQLRLIDTSADHIFVFRPSEVDQTTGAAQVYIVPLRNIESMHLRQWFSSAPPSGPAALPSPSATP